MRWNKEDHITFHFNSNVRSIILLMALSVQRNLEVSKNVIIRSTENHLKYNVKSTMQLDDNMKSTNPTLPTWTNPKQT